MSKSPSLSDLHDIAKQHQLAFIIEGAILPEEPVLAIVNLRKRSLSVVSKRDFSQEQKITWADDVINAEFATLEEQQAFQATHRVFKALLQTDYGLGVINLTAVKKGGYVAHYEGYYVPHTQKNISLQSSNYNMEHINDKQPDMTLGYISAEKYRGFGGFMQHYPSNKDMAAYQLTPDFKGRIAEENLSPVNFKNRIFFKAMTDLPPFSLLGFSYKTYWCNQPCDPVLFNKKDGFSIPRKNYHSVKFRIKFFDTQFNEEACLMYYSLEDIQCFFSAPFSRIGDVVLKPEHLLPVVAWDIKFEKYIPKRMYSFVTISDLKAEDYLKLADYYSLIRDLEDMSYQQYVKCVVKLYQKAINLFHINSNHKQISYCKSQLFNFSQKHNSLLSAENWPTPQLQSVAQTYQLNLSFRRAAAAGNIQSVILLLALGAQLNSAGSPSRRTALHQAVIQNHLSLCQVLLDKKADPNLRDQKQCTPLDYAKMGSPIHQILKPAAQASSGFRKQM